MILTYLKGLYQRSQHDPRSAIIWHYLYHADRFSSLFLGLPYGINDAHFPHLAVSNTGDADFVPHLFTHKCAAIAGKIIDRNLTGSTSSYSSTIDLDDELQAISDVMPLDWWDVPDRL